MTSRTPREPAGGPASPSRRSLLGGGLVVAGSGLAGFAGARATERPAAVPARTETLAPGPADALEPGRRRLLTLPADAASPEEGASVEARTVVDPRGRTQAGVLTAPPAHATWVALDLVEGADRDSLRRVMRLWTADIDRLTRGEGTLTDTEPWLAALPASLTVTVGWGLGAYLAAGLEAERPAWCRPLPEVAIDGELDPGWSDGELLLQVCGDDPLTVQHAVGQLVASVRDLAVVRWRQNGFRRSHGMARPGAPMRNLFGQVDGTNNPGERDLPGLVHRADGSTAMVVRRVRFTMDTWAQAPQRVREEAIGRDLARGAPLTGSHERDPVDITARHPDGRPVIPHDAHVRRVVDANPRHRFLRRPYNYDDGGGDSGLFFVVFCQDPAEQFVPILRRMAQKDALNEWTRHVGSAVFHVLPGVPAGADAYLGSHLLDS
ncbi:Dyp-type peroxidase [Kytococcus schroeteri]|uniref:Peroxidase n=2 Tax=Kytococcus TaxID=57499 RepID=A0A2I1P955_9MICO|nr:Dyp-type peroxidase [Kytococcus schroeteri]PKZ41166.1 peroxidase [Kytococcus schroeteri]